MRKFTRSHFGKIIFLLALAWGAPGHAGESADSQLFREGRYALVGAEIDVSLQQGGVANCRRRVVLKIDTRTGETSVLQLAQLSIGDPTVISAVWAKVAESGNFLNNNNLSRVNK